MGNNKSKKVGVKNRTYYYFDDIIKIENFDFHNVLLDGTMKLFWFMTFCTKPWKVQNYAYYARIIGPEKYHTIPSRIRYLTGLKSGITYVDSHNYGEIKIDSHDNLPL